jgi:hypothetical protein
VTRPDRADEPDLLPEVKRAFGQFRFSAYPSGRGSRVLGDDHGDIAIVAPIRPPADRHVSHGYEHARAVVTAKRGPYTPYGSGTEYASFMWPVVAWALTRDDLLIQCYGTRDYRVEDCWVFDARQVAEQVDEDKRGQVDSKKARDVDVAEASRAAHGVGLGDWLRGDVRLPSASESRATTLRRFGIEPEEVEA